MLTTSRTIEIIHKATTDELKSLLCTVKEMLHSTEDCRWNAAITAVITEIHDRLEQLNS